MMPNVAAIAAEDEIIAVKPVERIRTTPAINEIGAAWVRTIE